MTTKTATIQYKLVTSLAGKNKKKQKKMHLHITRSHTATFKYHMHYPIWMAYVSAAVISVTFPDIVTWNSQAVCPTNGLGTTRLVISVKTNKQNKTKFCCCCQITALVQAQGFSLRVRSGHETHKHRWLAPIDQLGSCIQCPLTSPCTLFTSPFKLETHNNESVETIPVQSLAC